jgi:hypothetical protein
MRNCLSYIRTRISNLCYRIGKCCAVKSDSVNGRGTIATKLVRLQSFDDEKKTNIQVHKTKELESKQLQSFDDEIKTDIQVHKTKELERKQLQSFNDEKKTNIQVHKIKGLKRKQICINDNISFIDNDWCLA